MSHHVLKDFLFLPLFRVETAYLESFVIVLKARVKLFHIVIFAWTPDVTAV